MQCVGRAVIDAIGETATSPRRRVLRAPFPWFGGKSLAAPLATANGRGVHALSRQLPAIGSPPRGVHTNKKPRTQRNRGVHAGLSEDLAAVFGLLADRLRRVRVCCGEWKRVLGRSTLGIETEHGMSPCGVFLDPPYSMDREKRLYREDSLDVAAEARAWAIENGDNKDLRIALCGYEGEHDMPDGWTVATWRSHGSGRNRGRERIWFSRHCLEVSRQRDLFDEAR